MKALLSILLIPILMGNPGMDGLGQIIGVEIRKIVNDHQDRRSYIWAEGSEEEGTLVLIYCIFTNGWPRALIRVKPEVEP